MVEQVSNISLTERFCERLGCRGLISDDSANPYSWLLVQGVIQIENVSIDTNRSNEEESKIFVEQMAPITLGHEIKHVA